MTTCPIASRDATPRPVAVGAAARARGRARPSRRDATGAGSPRGAVPAPVGAARPGRRAGSVGADERHRHGISFEEAPHRVERHQVDRVPIEQRRADHGRRRHHAEPGVGHGGRVVPAHGDRGIGAGGHRLGHDERGLTGSANLAGGRRRTRASGDPGRRTPHAIPARARSPGPTSRPSRRAHRRHRRGRRHEVPQATNSRRSRMCTPATRRRMLGTLASQPGQLQPAHVARYGRRADHSPRPAAGGPERGHAAGPPHHQAPDAPPDERLDRELARQRRFAGTAGAGSSAGRAATGSRAARGSGEPASAPARAPAAPRAGSRARASVRRCSSLASLSWNQFPRGTGARRLGRAIRSARARGRGRLEPRRRSSGERRQVDDRPVPGQGVGHRGGRREQHVGPETHALVRGGLVAWWPPASVRNARAASSSASRSAGSVTLRASTA